MVEAIVKKIMTTGITKYAKAYNVPPEQVQIKVTNDPNGTVFYTMCNNFKAIENVSFLQIMDKKMDIFQYEALANPFLKKSLEKSGRRMGGNPIDWCGTLNEIPLKRLKFQVWNSNNQEWVDQDIKSWLNPETTSNKVVKLKVTIKETMKSLLSQFTSNN